jgi:hypothetical protein
MNMQHDAGGLGVGLVKNLLEDLDYELHRRVVVVEQYAFVQRRLFGFGLFLGTPLGDDLAVAIIIAATASVVTSARFDYFQPKFLRHCRNPLGAFLSGVYQNQREVASPEHRFSAIPNPMFFGAVP